MKKNFSKIFILFFASIILSGAGYVGTLPDLQGEIKKNTPNGKLEIEPPPSYFENLPLTPAPSTKLYYQTILKDKRNSAYDNDIKQLIPILEDIKNVLASQERNQILASKVNVFNFKAQSILDKYKGKEQEYFTSYKLLKDIKESSKFVSDLKIDAELCMKYISYNAYGGAYTQENISKVEQELISKIDEVVYMFKQLDE